MITKRLDLFVQPDTLTKEQVVKEFTLLLDKIDNSKTDYAHYFDVTELDTGNKYMLFGANAQATLKVGEVKDILNKSAILNDLEELETDVNNLDLNLKDLEKKEIYPPVLNTKLQIDTYLLIKDNYFITGVEIQKKLKNTALRTVYKSLAELKELGLILKVGADKNGGYKIK